MADLRTRHVRCCIVGGGPAGIMLGFLLARAGVQVLVLEKHTDFLRDFRGDTIHPSTLQVMDELRLLESFLSIPHTELREVTGRIGDTTLRIADFSHIPGPCKFIAFMPQWDFLNFMTEQARRYPSFSIEMQAEATGLLQAGDVVTGVQASTPQGVLTIGADLIVAADGRHSCLRQNAGLPVDDIGAPIDVLWLRLSRKPDDAGQTFGSIAPGGILVALDRGTYYQCALVIRKGGYEEVRARGLPALRRQIATISPAFRDRVDELATWEDIKLLTVAVNRARKWYAPNFLCIGDAAHAMSPIGGVGINLAIQDAVATANILAETLRNGPVPASLLAAVQRRRFLPTRITQTMQVAIQQRVLNRILNTREPIRTPRILRMLFALPFVRRIPARFVGVGFRPEHVRSPAG